VPEVASLYEPLTPEELLVLKGRLFGIDDATIHARIDRLLDGLELLERRHDPIAGFSKGMTQKVALCSALLVEAPVLILDEPMSGLDAPSALVIKEVLREYARRQRTVLYSTHVLDVAESLAHRIVVLHEGRLAAAGTLAELRARTGAEEKLEQIFHRLTEQSDPVARAKALLG
jgi:ABC-2 type transport system ATP-binding protein